MIKEGVQYKVRIDFIVQREIVHGLKYVQKTYRMGVPGKHIVRQMSNITIACYRYVHKKSETVNLDKLIFSIYSKHVYT